MEEVDSSPRFGAELKDGYKSVNAWVSNGIAWLEDLQQFYRERAAIEKEYSGKLSALAKRHFEKKSKRSSGLTVGDTPTLTPGSLESASLNTWTANLSTLESRAAEHDRYSTELTTQVADPLRTLAARFEDIRKIHAEYAAQLEKERDTAYADLKKNKTKYDGSCQEVENRRRKTEGSSGKAQTAYQQQLGEMRNVKNSYLININVTNKLKEKYYYEYVPELLDSLQDVSEARVNQVNMLWVQANSLELSTLDRSNKHLNSFGAEIPQNEPYLDSEMFVKHNLSNWHEPPDMTFEPSPLWHDDSAMAVDDVAKIYLRNVLGRSKGQLKELKVECDRKGKEVQDVRRMQQRVREGREKKDEVEILKGLFGLQQSFHRAERQRIVAETETQTITDKVGDIAIGAQNHRFKAETFKIPTNCDLCGERIWGLSAKGFDCQDCGYTCHSKCELKVPPDCPGEQSKEDRRRLKAERQAASKTAPAGTNGKPAEHVAELPDLTRSNTMDTLSSGYAASAQRSIAGRASNDEAPAEKDTDAPAPKPRPAAGGRRKMVAPPPAQYSGSDDIAPAPPPKSAPSEPRGKMLYAYQATGEGELSVEENDEISIIEPDDGSGWTSIRHGSDTGVVPTAYFEVIADAAPKVSGVGDRPASTYSSSSTSLAGSTQSGQIKKKGPAVAPKRGAKKLRYVEALYDYEARTDSEFSMSEGERFVCVTRDTGDGWADVERGGVTKSVPANYVQDI